MNILITGAHGQLGTCLQDLQPAYAAHNWFNTDVEELDITSPEAIDAFIESHEIDGIVNCAAYTAVDRAESDEQLAQKLNAEAPAYLARAIERRQGFMIQISTDYVFSGTSQRPYTETDDTEPQSVYGRTKLVGEFNVLKLCSRSMIIRTAWLYSPYGRNFVKTMCSLGAERPEISVVNDQFGSPTSAPTLAAVIMHIINKEIIPGIYHYTNEGTTTWYDFTREIFRQAGINCQVKPISTAEYPTPAKRPAYSVLDKSKIKSIYHIAIPQWQEALADVIK